MRRLLSLAALGAALACASAQAQQVHVKIGVLSDMSSLYSDTAGPGSVAAAKMAIADFLKDHKDIKVDIVSADHQNKPDVGSNIARQWYDVDHVDAIADVPTSSVALAVADVTREKNKVFLISGAASSDLTGAKCTPNNIHWTYDTWMLANGTGKALVKNGGDTWFFLTADYAFGQALERDTAAVVEANGGKVVGDVKVPLNTADFSSYLLQAQASKAKIIGLANAGGDTINSIKQGAEFGIVKGGQKFAGLLVFASDVAALGLPTAQGLMLTETWYWDANEANRAWTKRWQQDRPGKWPTMVQAGVYAGTLHYLKAVYALKSAANGAGGGRQDEGAADRRHPVRQGQGPRRRSGDPPGFPVRGEEAGGIQASGRLLQAAGDHPGRRGVPSVERRQLPAGRDVMRCSLPPRALGSCLRQA